MRESIDDLSGPALPRLAKPERGLLVEPEDEVPHLNDVSYTPLWRTIGTITSGERGCGMGEGKNPTDF